MPPEPHLVPLPGTQWLLWQDAVLRTAGFPADGVLRLSAQDCAATADAYLDGLASEDDVVKALAEAIAQCSREIYGIAADPLFREAVTWQSTSALSALDGIVKAGPEPLRNSKQRLRQRAVARYWQRYCVKAETIGFFGPVCWAVIDPDVAIIAARPGPSLLRDRRVFFEHWALVSYADVVCADPRVRPWLPPALAPELTMADGRILAPARPPAELSRVEHAVLASCDGRRLAREVALAVLGQRLFQKEEDVYIMLGRLAERGLLRWKLDLPVSPDAERLLAGRLAAIGDRDVAEPALAGLASLTAARDAVAAAAGEPAKLARALTQLDDEFAAVTGTPPTRRPGEMYAARTICAEDTTRDLDVTIGSGILTAIAAPLAILLQAARWVSAAMAQAYNAALAELHREFVADLGTPAVPLGQLWFLAQGLFYGAPPRPADRVMAEFSQRLSSLYGLETPGKRAERQVELSSAALLPLVGTLFPAQRPGWSAARIHSPDLLISAASTDAIQREEFTVVLSELHVAWATCAAHLFVDGHPDPVRLRAGYAADMGTGRIDPLLPADWPRNTPRLAFALGGAGDVQLGFAPAPGADPDRLLPVTAVSVTGEGGSIVAKALDGRAWPLTELFSRQLAEVTVDAFKLAMAWPHSPRVVIDRMVVAREAWRTTVAATGFADARGERERYLAARQWRRELGLPEQVFVTIGTEVKPVFADLTSPLYVETLGAMLRAARAAGGDTVPVTVTEMLPACDQVWAPDAAGRRYVSELRLQVRDPEQAWSGQGSQP